MKNIILFFTLLSTFIGFSQAITVNPSNISTNTVQHIVQDILIDSPCALVSNFQTQGLCGVGNFDYTGTNFEFSGGMILRCGLASNTAGPYTGASTSSVCSGYGDAELLAISQANGNTGTINDVTFVKFDFTPLTDSFSFNFIFASNEYGTYQCGYSDVFAFILTDLSTGISTNLAVIPGTSTPVSVTNIRDIAYNGACPSVNETFFDTYNVSLPAGSTALNMRGYTVPMTAFADVIPNNNYSIKLAIGDYNDTAFDSAVFIEAGSFNVGTANLSYPLSEGIEDTDMLVSNGFAICPGDVRVLDTGLNPASYVFEWTTDTGSGPTVIAGETSSTYTVSTPGIYCVTANNASGGSCTQTDCIIVEYLPGFVINTNPNDLLSCSNTFDLSQNTATILNGLDPFTYDVLFYETLQDAIDNLNQISVLQTTTTTVTTFYVRVESFTFACPQITQFDTIITTCQITTPPDMIVCDDITNDGTAIFNLTS
ncbi:choice-of-anchor L domain-containing protein, partial [uncultured Flavobacterium sp.]|uniref:choice-of-anchor L domain-containing protein n=1 Tax=uncultured Flavobacterium sp. TaxID=165435 RepID=UPI0030CA1D29